MTTATTAKTPSAAKVVEDAIANGKKTIDDAVKMSKEATAKQVEHFAAVGKEWDGLAEKLTKSLEDLSGQAQANADAAMTAGGAYAKGVEDLTKAYFGLATDLAEQASQTYKAMFGVKTFKEAIDLQSDLAWQAFDKVLTEGSRLSTLSVKVVNETTQPVTQRWTEAWSAMAKIRTAA